MEAIDHYVYSIVSKWIHPVLTSLMIKISYFGSATILIPIALLLWIFYKNRGNRFFINLALIYSSNEIIKLCFLRERPNILRLVHITGYSFPSGHSMVSFAFYGFIIMEFMDSDYKYKKIVSILLMILIITIGISRIYLGVHYFSDVIGGFLLAWAYLLFIKNISFFQA